MTVAPSFQDFFDVGRAEAILKRPDLAVLEGDVSEMLLYAASAMAHKCGNHSSTLFRKTFMDGATDDDLTFLITDRYSDITRQPAVAAAGTVEFTRVSPTGPAGNIPAGTVLATAINAAGEEFRFVTDSILAFALDEQGPLSIAVTAQATGRGSNVPLAGNLNRIIDALFDSFTVTNPAAIAGGAPEETDEAYKQRAREFLSTLRRGTEAALIFGAKEVTAVKVASVFVGPTGLVTVYVSDIDGNSTAQMIADAQTEIDTNWKAAADVVTVAGGAPIIIAVDYSLTVRPGTDVAALEAPIALAIAGVMNKLGQGETLSLELLAAVSIAVNPDNITKITFNTPLADIDPLDSQLIRPGTITRS